MLTRIALGLCLYFFLGVSTTQAAIDLDALASDGRLAQRKNPQIIAEALARLPIIELVADECVVLNVRRNGYLRETLPEELRDVVAESTLTCASEMQILIHVYNQGHGEGEGEKYFLEDYLKGIVLKVRKRIKNFVGH